MVLKLVAGKGKACLKNENRCFFLPKVSYFCRKFTPLPEISFFLLVFADHFLHVRNSFPCIFPSQKPRTSKTRVITTISNHSILIETLTFNFQSVVCGSLIVIFEHFSAFLLGRFWGRSIHQLIEPVLKISIIDTYLSHKFTSEIALWKESIDTSDSLSLSLCARCC